MSKRNANAKRRKDSKRKAKPARKPPLGNHRQTDQQAFVLAVQYHTAGNLPRAEQIYQQILKSSPNQPVALHLLGVLAYQVGKYAESEALISRSIAVKPDFAESHNSLGATLKALGRLEEAVACYQRAIALKPDFANAHSELGITLHQLGRTEEAVASLRKALAIKPDLAATHINLGNALRRLGRVEEAIACFNTSISLQPDSFEVYNNLATAYQELGRLEEAVANYRKAIAIKPDCAVAHSNLGRAFLELGRLEDAVASSRRAIALEPQVEPLWDGFAQCVKHVAFTSVDDELLKDLLHLLERPSAEVRYLVAPVLSALRQHPPFARRLSLVSIDRPIDESTLWEVVESLAAIPLFLRLMELSPIHDLEMEAMLTSLRRGLLGEALANRGRLDGLPFCVALAIHCFTNEYVFDESPEDLDRLESLQRQIADSIEREQEVSPFALAALATCRPLGSFPWAHRLLERDWDDDINRLLTQQIREPVEERSLRAQIPRLAPIENSVSQSVRDQYEENPYPRWVKAKLLGRARTVAEVVRNSLTPIQFADYESPQRPDVLIAGCGTGQHSLAAASCYLNARVVAVDLSLGSLAYAVRKTRELGISNIEYLQADILKLDQLGRQFDLIECVGVLHHLGDPMAGWQVLVDLLRPKGLMKIGLYSEFARQSVVQGRELIEEKRYSTSADDIRRCRRDVLSANRDSEISKLLEFWDFFSLSDCRDLLFHVQEHRFTLLQIDEALKSLGLKFLGFTTENQRVRELVDTCSSGNQISTSFAEWHEFEREHPNTFGNMYQFWCQKLS
jgi:Flp pilus assembly protein TadD/SAM-dependent methyltransferase